MQLLTLLPLALAAVVSAQDTTTSSSVDAFPQTTFLTQTNSDGVVTGQPTEPGVVTTQPTAVTTQPSVVTSQPAVDLLPAGFSGVTTLIYGNVSYTYSVGSGVTSLVQSTSTSTAAQTTASGSGTSASGSASASSTKASSAAGVHIKAGMGALAAAGAFFAVFM